MFVCAFARWNLVAIAVPAGGRRHRKRARIPRASGAPPRGGKIIAPRGTILPLPCSVSAFRGFLKNPRASGAIADKVLSGRTATMLAADPVRFGPKIENHPIPMGCGLRLEPRAAADRCNNRRHPSGPIHPRTASRCARHRDVRRRTSMPMPARNGCRACSGGQTENEERPWKSIAETH